MAYFVQYTLNRYRINMDHPHAISNHCLLHTSYEATRNGYGMDNMRLIDHCSANGQATGRKKIMVVPTYKTYARIFLLL